MHVCGNGACERDRACGDRRGQLAVDISKGYGYAEGSVPGACDPDLIRCAGEPYFRYHRYRYSINEECIDIKEGYLFVKRNIVPIERLHKLQTLKGPIDQMFKVAKVVVTTAGGDVTIRFLEEEKAEQIAENLRGRINEIVVSQREEDGEEDGE